MLRARQRTVLMEGRRWGSSKNSITRDAGVGGGKSTKAQRDASRSRVTVLGHVPVPGDHSCGPVGAVEQMVARSSLIRVGAGSNLAGGIVVFFAVLLLGVHKQDCCATRSVTSRSCATVQVHVWARMYMFYHIDIHCVNVASRSSVTAHTCCVAATPSLGVDVTLS